MDIDGKEWEFQIQPFEASQSSRNAHRPHFIPPDWHPMDDPVYDSDATIPGLTTRQTIKVRITSVNDAGESPPSH